MFAMSALVSSVYRSGDGVQGALDPLLHLSSLHIFTSNIREGLDLDVEPVWMDREAREVAGEVLQ